MTKTKKIAFLGICTALSMMLSYIDSQILLFPQIPGIRLGLANAVTVFLIYRVSVGEVCLVSFIRVALTSLLFWGNAFHIAYGLCGAALSIAVMLLLKRTGLLSCVGVSISGGVFHNVGQLLCAIALTSTDQLLFLLPALIIGGTVSGAGVGIVSALILSRTKNIKC